MRRVIFFILAVVIIIGSAAIACLHIAESVSRDVVREAQRQEERGR